MALPADGVRETESGGMTLALFFSIQHVCQDLGAHPQRTQWAWSPCCQAFGKVVLSVTGLVREQSESGHSKSAFSSGRISPSDIGTRDLVLCLGETSISGMIYVPKGCSGPCHTWPCWWLHAGAQGFGAALALRFWEPSRVTPGEGAAHRPPGPAPAVLTPLRGTEN